MQAKPTITVVTVIVDQLSFLPYMGCEMSTGQNAVMLCGWRVKAEHKLHLLS